jgi:acyl-CoA-binding protein
MESEEFDAACKYVRGIAGRLENADLLYFYARFKQVTEGVCTTPKPSFYQLAEKSKWYAWTELGDLDQSLAQDEYIERLDILEPEWRGMEAKDPTSGWVSVSCPRPADQVPEQDKTVWDRVQDGDIQVLKRILTPEKMMLRDESGMSLLHWAADRGNHEVAELLLNLDSSMINLQDEEGQTALHYATSCEHSEMVRLLLERGADPSIQDTDGHTPCSTDTDPQIKDIFLKHEAAL